MRRSLADGQGLPSPPMDARAPAGDGPPPAIAIGPGASNAPSLADHLEVVVQGRWLIAGVTSAFLVIAMAYLVVAPRVFRTDVLVQVEGKSTGLAGLDDLTSMVSYESPAETEVEILRSRYLVGAVVDRLGLDVSFQPIRMPVVGEALARRWHGAGPSPARFGASSFGWGGELHRVDRLDVGSRLVGEELELVSGEGGRYAVRFEGRELVAGTVGAVASAGAGPERVELFVSLLEARPGTRFALEKRRRDDVVAELQRTLWIAEKGRKTGVIQLALEGTDPAGIAAVLDAMAQQYLRQNVERKGEEAEKSLQFIESQLPALKENLDRFEEQLNSYKEQKGSVDVSLETKGALQQAVEVEKALTELSLQLSELRQRFTGDHPALVALASKREKLLAERAVLDRRLKALPGAELASARLLRDVKTTSELYVLLLNKAQELRLLKSGTVGNVRIIDSAIVPYAPVSPRSVPALAVALALGAVLGLLAAFVRRALDEGVKDPDVVERAAGVPVYAAVPHAAAQDELARRSRRDGRYVRPLLAAEAPQDPAMESVRSLRTAIEFSLVEAESKVVAVVGAAPRAGKSFIAVNLAWVMADTGKRVLLVDADLRRGRLHRYFGAERGEGLSELIAGVLPLDRAIRSSPNGSLSYVTTGALPPNPSELLASGRFRQVLSELAARFDVVILDTAPILAVVDGAIAGRLAGACLMVVRAGQHPARELALAARKFRQNGVQLRGVIVNDLPDTAGSRRRYAYHYPYDYRAEG